MNKYIGVLFCEILLYLMGFFTKYHGELIEVPKKIRNIVFFSREVTESRLISILLCAYMEIMIIVTLLLMLIDRKGESYTEIVKMLIGIGFMMISGIVFLTYIKSETIKLWKKIICLVCGIVLILFSIGMVIYILHELIMF